MVENGLPTFIALIVSSVIIGVLVIAAVMIGAILLMPAPA